VLAPLSDNVRDRLVMIARNWLAMTFVEPPNPRERIQRGEFQEAAREVVGKQEMFAGCLERLHNNKDADQQINNWVEEAKRLYTEVGRAQVRMDKEAEATAVSAVEVHWKSAGVQLLMDRATAEVGQAEASLLLALCKHEQAERVQVRLERASGPEAAQMKSDAIGAWQTALSAWKTYEQIAAAHAGFPGRAEHAKALAARAAKLAEADTKK
jgi:hypothetical protein